VSRIYKEPEDFNIEMGALFHKSKERVDVPITLCLQVISKADWLSGTSASHATNTTNSMRTAVICLNHLRVIFGLYFGFALSPLVAFLLVKFERGDWAMVDSGNAADLQTCCHVGLSFDCVRHDLAALFKLPRSVE
jgi:hypothetical protein